MEGSVKGRARDEANVPLSRGSASGTSGLRSGVEAGVRAGATTGATTGVTSGLTAPCALVVDGDLDVVRALARRLRPELDVHVARSVAQAASLLDGLERV